MSKVIDVGRYCPDCGDPLTNPQKCKCGWRLKRESGKQYSENCMCAGCKNKTDVIMWNNGELITRCAWHYTEDLRSAGKNQLRVSP